MCVAAFLKENWTILSAVLCGKMCISNNPTNDMKYNCDVNMLSFISRNCWKIYQINAECFKILGIHNVRSNLTEFFFNSGNGN